MNGPTHRIAAFAAIATVSAHAESRQGKEPTLRPVLDGTVAAMLTGLPDILEPALHPNHRQFFHSLVFAGAVGYGVYRAYHWQPTEDWQKLARWLAMIAGGAYLVHLALDATTRKSLPMIGKI